ncbi:MAG: ATP-binding protein [Nitrososphaeraceae archaeon]
MQQSNTKNKFDACGDSISPSVCMGFEPLKRAYLDFKRRGIKIRFITEINSFNIHYCKELLKIVTELRHLDGIMGNFGICDGREYLAAANIKEKQAVPQLIYSNVKEVVEQQQYIFESFWSRAAPAEQKIVEIEEGIVFATTEVLQNPQTTKEVFINMIKSAKEEILLVCPTINAFLREQRIGIIDLSIQAITRWPGLNVRIITPTSEIIDNIVDQINERRDNFSIQRIDYGEFVGSAVTTITIIVVDRKSSLVIEKIDDSRENFVEAIGQAVFSSSKPTVMSYVSIFESLWNQVLVYEQLKMHDKMRKDFINVAAHELRTPIVPILGLSEILRSRILKDNTPSVKKLDDDVKSSAKRYLEMLDIVIRNANRLSRLTEDILDVTKIESHTLRLKKEWFDLKDVILNIVQEFRAQTNNTNPANIGRKILYESLKGNGKKRSTFIEADKYRITQVLSNLINNAIKFTHEGGVVNVKLDAVDYQAKFRERTSQEIDEENEGDDDGCFVITVKDNGPGIDPDIFSKLFIKFVSKSYRGTGLGLYISKSIIEAHGGKIWAENNVDGLRGAAFSFTIPISNNRKSSIQEYPLSKSQQLEQQRRRQRH